MGASSSTPLASNKNRRKVSRVSAEDGQLEDPSLRASRLLMQNGQLGQTGTWHTKAHSMYELQRERSMEANTVAVEETEREHQQQENSNHDNNNIGIEMSNSSNKSRSPIKFNSREKAATASTSTGTTENDKDANTKGSPKDVSQISKHDSQAGPSSSTAGNYGEDGIGGGLRRESTASGKPTQRRRPLTWAWLRGHEVSLPSPAEQQAEKKAAALNAGRRRSLKVGTESSLAVHAANNDWGIQRQLSSSSANSASSASAPIQNGPSHHNPLGRRASQGRPLLSQLGRQKSIRKSDAGLPSMHNPISALGREIIQFCFEQPHNEIGVRICSRLLEKRPDFRNFVYTMGKERWLQMTGRLKEFIETVVRRVDNIDIVERVARKYGEEHVELKCFGFKPDFWVSLADAITVECVILDQATHQPSDTITAWSLLVSIMFSAVRDGYYQAMRAQRISQRHKNVHQREMALKVGSPGPGGSVEKSQSANELSPNKKSGGTNVGGTFFKYSNELTVQSEEGAGKRNGTEEKQKQSPKKVEFFTKH